MTANSRNEETLASRLFLGLVAVVLAAISVAYLDGARFVWASTSWHSHPDYLTSRTIAEMAGGLFALLVLIAGPVAPLLIVLFPLASVLCLVGAIWPRAFDEPERF